MKIRLMSRGKRAVVGIGMLILFIATILISALASGVIIRATDQLQARALEVEEASRSRLVNRIEIVTLYAQVNTSEQQVSGFEMMTRLAPGSYEINLDGLNINFFSAADSYEMRFANVEANQTECTPDNIIIGREYCITEVFGNADQILEQGEVVKILFWFNESDRMGPDEPFHISFIPRDGAVVNVYGTTPKDLNRRLVSLRI